MSARHVVLGIVKITALAVNGQVLSQISIRSKATRPSQTNHSMPSRWSKENSEPLGTNPA